jgi:putative acetyltransferase
MREPAERLDLARHIATATTAPGIAVARSAAQQVLYRLINMQIRLERPEDATTIHALTDTAFKGMPFSDDTEASVIDALRAAGALTLSLLATQGGEIVGHIAFSPVTINGEAGDWYGLGPVSVWPDRQRQGIGQALIREGLQRLKSIGAGGCVLLGNPAYYGRFGFENDPDLRHAGAPPEAFQCLTLNGPRPRGEVSFHPGFDGS